MNSGEEAQAAASAYNPSLVRKSVARLAAVQCIYQDLMDKGASTPQQLIEQYKSRNSEDDEDPGRAAEPDYKYLEQLLRSWRERQTEVEQELDANLLEGWTRNRMSPLMVAILCAALCERHLHPTLKPAIWLDEYVTIAGSFFSEQEVGFVNRLLDNLAG